LEKKGQKMPKKEIRIVDSPVFVRLALLVCIVVMTPALSFAKEDATNLDPRQSQLQVSVGDFLVVAQAPPWAWAISETNYSFESIARPGELAHVRPPRCIFSNIFISSVALIRIG
jgi:hypothetical protein